MDSSTIRRNIKSNAKFMLKGNFGSALLVILIPILVSLGLNMLFRGIESTLFPQYVNFLENLDLSSLIENNRPIDSSYLTVIIISFILSLISALVMVPLTFGQTQWFVKLSEGKKESIGTLFDWFGNSKYYLKSILISLNVAIRSFFYTLIYLVVIIALPIMVFVLSYQYSYDENAAMVIFIIVLMVALIPLIVFLLRYELVVYLAVRFPDRKINRLIKDSVVMMKGHKWEMFVFYLSFILWYLLSAVLCGLPLFWVIPYLTGATVIFCNYIYDFENNRINKDVEPVNNQPAQPYFNSEQTVINNENNTDIPSQTDFNNYQNENLDNNDINNQNNDINDNQNI